MIPLFTKNCRPIWPSSGAWLGARISHEEAEQRRQATLRMVFLPLIPLIVALKTWHWLVDGRKAQQPENVIGVALFSFFCVFICTRDIVTARHLTYTIFFLLSFIFPLWYCFFDPIFPDDEIVAVLSRRLVNLGVLMIAQAACFGQISFAISSLALPGLASYVIKCALYRESHHSMPATAQSYDHLCVNLPVVAFPSLYMFAMSLKRSRRTLSEYDAGSNSNSRMTVGRPSDAWDDIVPPANQPLQSVDSKETLTPSACLVRTSETPRGDDDDDGRHEAGGDRRCEEMAPSSLPNAALDYAHFCDTSVESHVSAQRVVETIEVEVRSTHHTSSAGQQTGGSGSTYTTGFVSAQAASSSIVSQSSQDWVVGERHDQPQHAAPYADTLESRGQGQQTFLAVMSRRRPLGFRRIRANHTWLHDHSDYEEQEMHECRMRVQNALLRAKVEAGRLSEKQAIMNMYILFRYKPLSGNVAACIAAFLGAPIDDDVKSGSSRATFHTTGSVKALWASLLCVIGNAFRAR